MRQLVNTVVYWSFQLSRFTFLSLHLCASQKALPICPNVSYRGSASPRGDQSYDLGPEQLRLLAQWSPVMSKGQKDSGYTGWQGKTC